MSPDGTNERQLPRHDQRPSRRLLRRSIDGKQISTYTQKVERLRLIEREVPLTEEKAKPRRGRYRLLDPLFRFWFRFVYGNEDRYERLGEDAYEALIEPELADFVSPVFETLCQDALPSLYPDELFLDVGRWWYKEHEIDVVGFTDGGTMVVEECKFTNAPLEDRRVYSVLFFRRQDLREMINDFRKIGTVTLGKLVAFDGTGVRLIDRQYEVVERAP